MDAKLCSLRLNFDLKLFNQAQSLLGTHYCSSFLFFPKPHILIPQFSHMIWLVFFFLCLQLFLTPMPRPGIELKAELHQTGTFEGRSTNRATWPPHYSSFLRWAIPGVFFFIFVFSVFFCTIGRSNFANDGIQTTDIWCWKRPLYQLSHHHCRPIQR